MGDSGAPEPLVLHVVPSTAPAVRNVRPAPWPIGSTPRGRGGTVSWLW